MIEVVYWVRGQKHAELAALSIASVRNVYGGEARVFFYTDDPELEPVPDAQVFLRLPAGRPMMVANLDAQFMHIASSGFGTRILFLDADVLVRKPFRFDTEDLYVTWRDHISKADGQEKGQDFAKRMPYNYGVLGAIANPATIEIFAWLRARILGMCQDHQKWYGNQLALVDLCGGPQASNKRRIPWTLGDTGGTEFLLERLPCAVWNAVPEKVGEDISGLGMIHLKGGRKDMMEHYLARVLEMP